MRAGCLRALCLKFKSVHIPPGNILIHRGEQIDAIYFLMHGCVEVLTHEGVELILGKSSMRYLSIVFIFLHFH